MARSKLKSQSSEIFETGWVEAGETWTYAGADAPTYTITVPSDATTKYQAGMRIKLTQPTDGVKYFLVTKVTATVLTVYGGTDYDLDNEAVTAPFYSMQKAPFGFPLDPSKWTEEVLDTSTDEQNPTVAGTWYNTMSAGQLPSLSIPIGIWNVSYDIVVAGRRSTAIDVQVYATLSTTNNSETDDDWTAFGQMSQVTSGTIRIYYTWHKEKVLDLSVKDTYYLNMKAEVIQIIASYGGDSPTTIRAVSAYL